jgi:hypothetical protein
VAEPTKSDPLTAELENRLDELFQEDGPPAETVPPRTARQQPLAELKKTVLSIDWEITPEAVDSFLAQIRLLKEVYSNDQAATVLLQILGSLGQYIKSSRSKVHPSTFSLLNSVFARLEEVTHHPGMPELTKRKLLQAQMSAYQQLREKVSKRRTTDRSRPAPARTPATAPAGPPAAGGAVSAAMLAQAMAELKEFIRAEMDALRREMKTGPSR